MLRRGMLRAQPMSDRDQTILIYRKEVLLIAARLASRMPSCVEKEDLVGVGTLGLIDAINRFDPSRGVSFKTYAEIRIRGAMLDSLRDDEWAPVAVRRKATEQEEVRDRLIARLGREPTHEELARGLALSAKEFEHRRTEAEIYSLISFAPGASYSDEPAVADNTLVERQLERERHERVRTAIVTLPEREREIIEAHYGQGRSLREIGADLGLADGRVSQIHMQAIRRLRRLLQGQGLTT